MTRVSRLAVRVSVSGAAALAVGALMWTPVRAQEPPATFRSSVDVIAISVQIVDEGGQPVAGLGADDFEVSISGRRRPVVSAEHVQTAQVDGQPFPNRPGAQAVALNLAEDGTAPSGRTYILAFDVGSLTVEDSRAAVGSSLNFIDRLLPNDQIGLFTFPVGQHVAPTTDHRAVRQEVSRVVGSPQQGTSRFNLSFAEIVDINSEAARLGTLALGNIGGGAGPGAQVPPFGREATTLQAVRQRECGADVDGRCAEEIQQEAEALGFHLESRGLQELNGLRDLISGLGAYPGRKTVVMFSSGIPASDGATGRPDLGDLPRAVGQAAATSHTTIYAVHVDTADSRAMSAESRRAPGGSLTRSRDRVVGSRVLEEFSAASGGTVVTVYTGSGETVLDRVLRETSSHYLLGVEPDASDRDGRVRALKVEVSVDDVTVRSPTWVVVPERPGS